MQYIHICAYSRSAEILREKDYYLLTHSYSFLRLRNKVLLLVIILISDHYGIYNNSK